MADVYLANENTNLATALGTVNAADSVFIQDFAVDYVNGDISADDLTLLSLSPGFSGRFVEAGKLVAVVNQTSTGIFRNESNSPRTDLESTSTAGVIYNVVNKAARGDGQLHLNTVDCNNFYQVAGIGFIETNADVNNAFCYGGQLWIRRTGAATTFPLGTCVVTGGFCELGRDVGTLNVTGGSVRVVNTDVTPGTAVNLDNGTIEVIETGTWTGGTMLTGTIDLRNLKRSFTATGQTWHPGVKIRVKRTNSATMTRASATDVAGGPTFIYED